MKLNQSNFQEVKKVCKEFADTYADDLDVSIELGLAIDRCKTIQELADTDAFYAAYGEPLSITDEGVEVADVAN